MSLNVYSDFLKKTGTELATGLTGLGYTPLTVKVAVWKPRALPVFEKFYVQVAPPLSNLWTERRISTKEVQYVLRANIFLLVKNYDEELSLHGDDSTAPDLGIFQLISDVKNLLRATNLNGLLSRTYNETVGDVAFESGAASGFDVGSRDWVHRALVPYTGETEPFCFPPS